MTTPWLKKIGMNHIFAPGRLSASHTGAILIAFVVTGLYGGLLYRDAQSVHLQVTMKSSVNSAAVLYYDTGNGLSEHEKATNAVAGDHRYHLYTFPLPRHRITHLRFDPLATSGEVAVKAVSVMNGLNQTVLTIGLQQLKPVHQIKAHGTHGGILTILTDDRASDPQIDILLNAPLDPESLGEFPYALFVGRLLLLFLAISLCLMVAAALLKKLGIRIGFLDHPYRAAADLVRGKCLFLFAVLVMVLFRGWFAWTYPLETCSDSSNYYELFRSGQSILVHATGYPYLMHFLSPLLPSKRDLLLLQHALDFGVQLLIMIVLRRRFGDVAAITAGLFYGLDPGIINWASRARPEWLQGAFLALAFVTAMEAFLLKKAFVKGALYLLSAWAFTWTVLVKFLTVVLLPVYLLLFALEGKQWRARWFCFPAMGMLFFLQVGIFVYWYHYPSTGTTALTHDKAWIFSDKISYFLPSDQPYWNSGPWSRRYALLISDMPMSGFDVDIFKLYRRVDAVPEDIRAPYQKRYRELLSRSDAELIEAIKGRTHLKDLRNNYLVSGYLLGLPATDTLLTMMLLEAIASYPKQYLLNVFDGIGKSLILTASYYAPILKNPQSDHPFQLDDRQIRFVSPGGYAYYSLPDPMRCLYDEPVFLVSGLIFFSRWLDYFHMPTLAKWILLFMGLLCTVLHYRTGLMKQPEMLYMTMGMLVLLSFILLANMIFQFRGKELQASQHLLCALMGVSFASMTSYARLKWRNRPSQVSGGG